MNLKERLLDIYSDGGEWEDFEPVIDEMEKELATLRAQLAEAQKAVNEAADIFQFVANEDMQIMENGYQAEEMAGHWISKYSKLVTTA